MIAGFPTETEAQFENTLALVDDCILTYLHIFPYSERIGTPAARMPQVPGDERRRRAGLLREKGRIVLEDYLARRVHSKASVLIERPGFGRDEQFALVELEQSTAKKPTKGIVEMNIIGVDRNRLVGRLSG